MKLLQEEAVVTTWSGRQIDLLHPVPAKIHIDDIAWSLTRTMRFNGHTIRPYSVAEHCLLGATQCVPERRLEFLLHDATEAYLGDVVGPLKRIEMFSGYRQLEESWRWAIALRFGLSPESTSHAVETVDKRMLATEMRDLMGIKPLSTDKYRPFSMVIGDAPDALAERFLAKFSVLVRRTEGARR